MKKKSLIYKIISLDYLELKSFPKIKFYIKKEKATMHLPNIMTAMSPIPQLGWKKWELKINTYSFKLSIASLCLYIHMNPQSRTVWKYKILEALQIWFNHAATTLPSK